MSNVLKKCFPVFLLLQCLAFGVLAADQVQIRADAPTSYEVVEGDTLWDISGRFLEDPWLWPEVWELNPQIENPHLIYPGDVVEVQYSTNGPLLTLRRGGSGVPDADGLRTVRLSPQIRREPLSSAIPAIPLDRISSFLSLNVVISESELNNAPYLFGNRSGKLFGSNDDVVYAKGDWDSSVFSYDIVRGGSTYLDPETGSEIGIEGQIIGSATIIERDGQNATLTITNLIAETRDGDRFIAAAGSSIEPNYFPQPPTFDVDADILDIMSGRSIGNQYDTIVINKGSSDRLRTGDLVALQKPEILIEDNYGEATLGEKFKRAVRLSEDHIETFSGEIFASVLIYRVFDNTSFGIILNSDDVVRRDDKVVTP
jgi:hypothetical protein